MVVTVIMPAMVVTVIMPAMVVTVIMPATIVTVIMLAMIVTVIMLAMIVTVIMPMTALILRHSGGIRKIERERYRGSCSVSIYQLGLATRYQASGVYAV